MNRTKSLDLKMNGLPFWHNPLSTKFLKCLLEAILLSASYQLFSLRQCLPGCIFPNLVTQVGIAGVALSQPVTRVSYMMPNTDFRSLGLANNAEHQFRNMIVFFKVSLMEIAACMKAGVRFCGTLLDTFIIDW